jgi:peptide/nickel transport system ATP-binding protein
MAGSGKAHLRDDGDSLLLVNELVVNYKTGRNQKVHAVSNVSLDLRRGETLGLVGESGCGKSTTAKAVLMLQRPTSGTITFEGRELTTLKPRELRQVRRRLQLVFQDPISSLNPRRKVREIVAEGLSIN